MLEVGPAWIEVMPKGVSKASALLRIGKKLGISTEEMMAFGDAENDMEMIKTVKYGIAMGNAMDSLKQAAWESRRRWINMYLHQGSKLSFFMKKAAMEHDSIKLH